MMATVGPDSVCYRPAKSLILLGSDLAPFTAKSLMSKRYIAITNQVLYLLS